MIEQYGEEKGRQVYHAWLNKMGYDDTKPMPEKESFSWVGDVQAVPGVSNLIRGEALHPIKTVHPEEWPGVRVYLEEELEKAAHTLAGKPLLLDHIVVVDGEVTGAQYEDGAIEYVAQVNDPRILGLVKDKAIKHCSVEFEWKSLENVNGVAPRGINFTGLSLLKNFAPGDPLSTVEVWEGIVKQLKEVTNVRRKKEQAEPQEFILYMIRDPASFLGEHFSTAWLDLENGIQAIYGRLQQDPENPQPMALLFMKAKGWTLEKMQGWLQDHSQYLRQSQPAAGAPAGIQSVNPTPPTAQGVMKMKEQNQEPTAPEEVPTPPPEPSLEEIVGSLQQAVKQINENFAALDARVKALEEEQPAEEPLKEQEGEQEPEKDEHGCVIGKERWDPEQEKCVTIVTEQQDDQEPEKDEHGCIIGKEQWDTDQEKCVPIAAEEKKKGLGEAIVAPDTSSEPPMLVVPVEKFEAVMPSLQAERSMSWGAQRFVQDVKRLIYEARKEGGSA